MANVLITGGSGLLGWRTTEQLLEDGHEVLVFDLYPNRENLAMLPTEVEVVEGDVADLTALLRVAKRQRSERIVHLAAAISSVAAASPTAAIRDNVVGTSNVFEAALALDAEAVVWASTIGVNEARPDYDGSDVPEDYRGSPTQPYGASKLACEIIATAYREDTGLNAIGIRPPTAYGIGRLGGGTGLFNQAVYDVAKRRPAAVPSFEPCPTQPIYNRDMAAFFITALFAPPAPHAVYNTPVLRNYSAAEVATVLQGLRPEASVDTKPYPSINVPPPAMDASRARATFDFEPQWSLERALAEMLEHYEAAA